MVAKVVSGKSIRGILYYNENKIKNAEASLLMCCGFPRDADQLSFQNKLDRFNKLTSQNEMTKTNAMHISLNFSVQDRVDDILMKRIALDYMHQIGFGNQPFLVYRHFDAAHPHIHIATVNIADGGQRIETHNIGRNQSERARKDIEERYGLVKAEQQQKDSAYQLKPLELEKIRYGKSVTKAAISGVVRNVVASYKFASLPELNAILRQFNVMADRGEAGSKMFANKGLVYSLINEQGERVGAAIKASTIYSSPTLTNLEKKYPGNALARKPYALRIKYLLDSALKEQSGLEAVEQQLQEQDIRILLRQNVQGNVYGITFIDNGTRSVFNGSELGREYSAAAFMNRLGAAGVLATEEKPEVTSRMNQAQHPARALPVIERLTDVLLYDEHENNAAQPYKKRKKKRLQGE